MHQLLHQKYNIQTKKKAEMIQKTIVFFANLLDGKLNDFEETSVSLSCAKTRMLLTFIAPIKL